jgi:hypothetical protein
MNGCSKTLTCLLQLLLLLLLLPRPQHNPQKQQLQ